MRGMNLLRTVMLTLLLAGCGGGYGNNPFPQGSNPYVPQPVISSQTATGFTVSWPPVPNATGYVVYTASDSNTPRSSWTPTSTTGTSAQISSSARETVYVKVTSIISGTESDRSPALIGASSATTTTGWDPASGLGAGWQVTSVTFAPSSANTVYACANSGGSGALFKSSDSGTTWSSIRTFSGANLTRVVVDPADADIVYVTASKAGALSPTDGVYVVSGGGANAAHLFGLKTSSFLLFSGSPSRLLAGTLDTGMSISIDSGLTWPILATGLPIDFTVIPSVPEEIIDINYSGTATYCVTAKSGIYRSGNYGTSWSPTGLSVASTANSVRMGLAGETLYAGIGDGISGTVFVLKSVNSGGTWQPLATIPSAGEVKTVVAGTAYPGTIWVVTLNGLIKSSNDGATWSLLNVGLPDPTVISSQALIVHPTNPNIMFVGTNSGLYYTDNGGL